MQSANLVVENFHARNKRSLIFTTNLFWYVKSAIVASSSEDESSSEEEAEEQSALDYSPFERPVMKQRHNM